MLHVGESEWNLSRARKQTSLYLFLEKSLHIFHATVDK